MSVSARLGIGFMKALSHAPLPLIRGFGYVLGRILHTAAVPRRRVVDRNLELCFPGKSLAERKRISRDTFVYVAQSWLDRAWLWHAPREVVERRTTVMGAPVDVDEVLGGTTPLILFAPHFYGLDAAATGLTMRSPRESTTIYTTQRDPMLDEWVCKGRERFGNVKTLNRVDGIKPIVAALRKGGLLYLLPDMDFGRDQSVFVPFFGVQAATMPSLSRFARLGRAKVIPIISRVTRQGYEIEVLPEWKDFPSDDPVADTALMNERLAGYIETMPSQYYWVHRRFKTRPEGATSVY
ncbi:lipid A biosynthesis acyltransferase [Variovorax sp. dw_954]|uniref:lysophospholipid acyltransferase family protein n=1 Tax=Variovorax sp. dw_954 TaxID=2720078 RepID=UPI001BD5E519|nr:lipid A biosynthesis acyltransferase [Variovorax sp. dw_954]